MGRALGLADSPFRRLHGGPGAFVIPNPWDVGSARMLAGLGYSALATTSAGMAFAMGIREGQARQDAVLSHCRDIVQATPLPVSADLEKGFGDSPEAAAETIRLASGTGLAGCSLEDHTGDPHAPIFEETLAVERIAAAAEAARGLGHDFVLTARCESLLWGSRDTDAVIRRLQAFEAAGADVVYAPGLTSLTQIEAVCASVSVPVNVVMGMPGRTFSVDELTAAGVRRISVGSAFARLAYGAFIDAARSALDSGCFTPLEAAKGFAEIEALLPEGRG